MSHSRQMRVLGRDRAPQDQAWPDWNAGAWHRLGLAWLGLDKDGFALSLLLHSNGEISADTPAQDRTIANPMAGDVSAIVLHYNMAVLVAAALTPTIPTLGRAKDFAQDKCSLFSTVVFPKNPSLLTCPTPSDLGLWTCADGGALLGKHLTRNRSRQSGSRSFAGNEPSTSCARFMYYWLSSFQGWIMGALE